MSVNAVPFAVILDDEFVNKTCSKVNCEHIELLQSVSRNAKLQARIMSLARRFVTMVAHVVYSRHRLNGQWNVCLVREDIPSSVKRYLVTVDAVTSMIAPLHNSLASWHSVAYFPALPPSIAVDTPSLAHRTSRWQFKIFHGNVLFKTDNDCSLRFSPGVHSRRHASRPRECC